ncbi:MAG: pitrilysin family protein [candidate division WOR-3 bacterium]|nr:pitrilysin family protein [candidate division WOR-3 bacterium]
MMKNLPRILFAILLGSIPLMGIADTYTDLEERVVEHELRNGMRFLILERHNVPLVSMVIVVRVGSANEERNKTGLAHFIEHLMFKGTPTIGTANYKKESKALRELDAAYEAYRKAEQAGADSATVAGLYEKFKQRQVEAASYIIQGEWDELYSRQGAVGLNAYTCHDYTTFKVTLPPDRFKLWCAVESDRLTNAVFREFYKERDVVVEERRSGENNPSGIFFREFFDVCYRTHPYGRPVYGYPGDAEGLSRQDARGFFETYYVPQHMSAAIVGDVNAEEIIHLIDAYFSRIPEKPESPPLIAREPQQPGIRRVEMKMRNKAQFLIGFHTVPVNHEDRLALELLDQVLIGGETSRLYKSLIQERKLASSIRFGHSAGFYGGDFFLLVDATAGVAAAELEDAVLEELASLADNPITQDELDAVCARWRVGTYEDVVDNEGMANTLAILDQSPVGWREEFRMLEKASQVTPEQVMEAAERYLDPDRRTVGLLEVADE